VTARYLISNNNNTSRHFNPSGLQLKYFAKVQIVAKQRKNTCFVTCDNGDQELYLAYYTYICKGKGRFGPTTDQEGPEGSGGIVLFIL
jgi:hypothetical protein